MPERMNPGGPRPQRQDSLTDQMQTVDALAVDAGCYDAVDWIRRTWDAPSPDGPRNPGEEVERLRKALREQVASWLTIAPILEAHIYEPNASGYVWNAWTRWGERAAERAEAAALEQAQPDPQDEWARGTASTQTGGEVAFRLADLCLSVFGSVHPDEAQRKALADGLVDFAVRWINDEFKVGLRPDSQDAVTG